MALSLTLSEYLEDRHIPYDTLVHERTESSLETVGTAHISGDDMAKAVLLRTDGGYLMAVIPASHKLNLDKISHLLDGPVQIAGEGDMTDIFDDCALGALPIAGMAYGLRTMCDISLERHREIYFEGGDHKTLVHTDGKSFDQMMEHADHASISDPI